MPHSTGPSRVCVLTDEYLYEWQVAALEQMVRDCDVEISLVVLNRPIETEGYDRHTAGSQSMDSPRRISRQDLRLFLDMITSEGIWAFVLAERKLAWLLGISEPKWTRYHAVADVGVLSETRRIECQPVSNGDGWNRLPDRVVDIVTNESDVVVRFGFGLLTGRILEESDYGVLSFHPADIRRFRGLGPSMAFIEGREEAGATLQKLTDDIDAGEIILVDSVDVSDAKTLDEVEERVAERQIPMLAEGISKLQDPGFNPTVPDELGEYTPLSKRRELGFALRILYLNGLNRYLGWAHRYNGSG